MQIDIGHFVRTNFFRNGTASQCDKLSLPPIKEDHEERVDKEDGTKDEEGRVKDLDKHQEFPDTEAQRELRGV